MKKAYLVDRKGDLGRHLAVFTPEQYNRMSIFLPGFASDNPIIVEGVLWFRPGRERSTFNGHLVRLFVANAVVYEVFRDGSARAR